MSAAARWREVVGRMPSWPGRWPGAVAAVLGGLLAVPALPWPTMRVTFDADPGSPEPTTYVQEGWSWGKWNSVSAAGEPLPRNEVLTNLWPAWTLALACLAAVIGGVVWLLRRGSDGRALGVPGVSFLLAVVVGSVAEQRGNIAVFYSGGADSAGASVEDLPAGQLLLASAVLLVAALLLMLWQPLVRLGRSAVEAGTRVAARGRAQALAEEAAQEAAPKPRVGTATLRDVPSASRSSGRASSQGDLSERSVGFSDGADEERFRPPR